MCVCLCVCVCVCVCVRVRVNATQGTARQGTLQSVRDSTTIRHKARTIQALEARTKWTVPVLSSAIVVSISVESTPLTIATLRLRIGSSTSTLLQSIKTFVYVYFRNMRGVEGGVALIVVTSLCVHGVLLSDITSLCRVYALLPSRRYMISNETLYHKPLQIGLGWLDDSMTLQGMTEGAPCVYPLFSLSLSLSLSLSHSVCLSVVCAPPFFLRSSRPSPLLSV